MLKSMLILGGLVAVVTLALVCVADERETLASWPALMPEALAGPGGVPAAAEPALPVAYELEGAEDLVGPSLTR